MKDFSFSDRQMKEKIFVVLNIAKGSSLEFIQLLLVHWSIFLPSFSKDIFAGDTILDWQSCIVSVFPFSALNMSFLCLSTSIFLIINILLSPLCNVSFFFFSWLFLRFSLYLSLYKIEFDCVIPWGYYRSIHAHMLHLFLLVFLELRVLEFVQFGTLSFRMTAQCPSVAHVRYTKSLEALFITFFSFFTPLCASLQIVSVAVLSLVFNLLVHVCSWSAGVPAVIGARFQSVNWANRYNHV